MTRAITTADLPTHAQLSALPPAEAERIFNALDLDTQRAAVLATPFAQRQDLIILSRDAEQLVQSLPEDELYWTIKVRGTHDSLAVITRTSFEQFEYCIDLDCWQRDCIDTDQALNWLHMLSRCHERKVLEWFEQADDELLVILFKSLMHIRKIEHETDISEEYEAMPEVTIDNIHYFAFVSEAARISIMPLLQCLYQYDRMRFHSIMEGIIWDPRVEAEESAHTWRTARITEKGFCRFDEAQSVYAPLSDRERAALIGTAAAAQPAAAHDSQLPMRYLFSSGDMPAFLARVCRLMSAAGLERFQQHSVTIANKLLQADGKPISDPETMRAALHTALGLISIGCEDLADGDTGRAAHLLSANHPELLARAGTMQIAAIRSLLRAGRATAWTRDRERRAVFCDSPLAEILDGIDRIRPMRYDAAADDYRPFTARSELAAARDAVQLALVAEMVVFTCLGCSEAQLEAMWRETRDNPDLPLPSAPCLCLTLLAIVHLRGTPEARMLRADEYAAFTRHLGSEPSAADGFLAQAHDWLVQQAQWPESLLPALSRFLAHCADALGTIQSPPAGDQGQPTLLVQPA